MSTSTVTIINEQDKAAEIHEIPQVLLDDLLPKRLTTSGKLWMYFLITVMAIGAFAYFTQLKNGLIVTDMRDYASWGIYISNFVFFVAISLVGSLISAVLKLTDVKWRTP